MTIREQIESILNNPSTFKLNYKQIIEKLESQLSISKQNVQNNLDYLFQSGKYVVIGNKIFSCKKLGLKRGKILASTKGYAFCEILDEKCSDYFISYTKLNGALDGDIVLIKQLLGKRGDSTEGEVVKILKHSNEYVVGKIQKSNNYAFVENDNEKFEGDIYIPKKYIGKVNDGQKVVVKINEFAKKGKSHKGEVVEVLGDDGDPLVEELSIIRAYNLFERFPSQIEKLKVPTFVSENEKGNRRDLSNLTIFTIDGEDAKDLDDAVSISKNSDGSYHLGVHIADVSHYVKPNTDLDKEAFKRGTSVYFPNMVLPMLPKSLSNGICSLYAGQDRLTMSVFMDINEEGMVIKYEICESFIKSVERMTYTDVYKMICGDEQTCKTYQHILKDVLMMEELSHILTEKRNKLGAIDFDIPECEFDLDENNNVLQIKKRERNLAHQLIENFMVAANECVADFAKKNKIPFVYRSHEKPYAEKLTDFISFANSLGVDFKINYEDYTPKDFNIFLKNIPEGTVKEVLSKVLLRTMQKAKYTPNCLGHFGLASEYYCHFTSPIRRYPDLVVHRMLKLFLHKKLNGKVLGDMLLFTADASVNSSEREKLAESAERDVDDLEKCLFMKNKVGEIFTGSVSGVTNNGIFVMLDNTVEGFIRREDLPDDNYQFLEKFYTLKGNKKSFSLGDHLSIKVDFVDIKKRRINFVLSE